MDPTDLDRPLDPLNSVAEAVFPSQNSTPSRRLYAISDLHLAYKENREALHSLKPHHNDSIILCGDVGETTEHLSLAFSAYKSCFDQVWWCPGNHELYTLPTKKQGPRGEQKYKECVEVARQYGVLTPEDDFVKWEGEGGPAIIAPIFTLYDYSFRPDYVKLEDAVAWAREENIEATDEVLLHPDPYPTRQDWCSALVARTDFKLTESVRQNPDVPVIIAGHWPLRQDLAQLFAIPRFSIWCGTKKTEDWHRRFNAKVVVSGHCHIRRTDYKDGVRFEEVSLGYPRQWEGCREKGLDINGIMREILPGPRTPVPGVDIPTLWRKYG